MFSNFIFWHFVTGDPKTKTPLVRDTAYRLQRISLVFRILCRLMLTATLSTTTTCGNRTDQNAFLRGFLRYWSDIFPEHFKFLFYFFARKSHVFRIVYTINDGCALSLSYPRSYTEFFYKFSDNSLVVFIAFTRR